MKHFYTLIFLFATYFTFGQANPNRYDYFVQFNGNQLSKKVSVDAVLNHPIITKYISKKPDFDLRKYTDIIQLDQKITVHGNFLDSVPFYQVTIPIKSKEAVTKYLIEKQGANGNNGSIQDFEKYAVFTPNGVKRTFAWNDNHLVVFELTKRLPTKFYDKTTSAAAMDSVSVVDYYEKDTIGEIPVRDVPTMSVPNSPKIAEPATNTEPVVFSDPADEYLYDGNPYEEYTAEQAEFDKKLAESQSEIIKKLFENGFTAPTSSKINVAADISSWVDYGGMISTLYSAYSYPMSLFGGFNNYLPMQKNFGNFVKGVNLDFYFDNDNARIEEIVEYSKEIAEVVSKIGDRKINRNIFNYFPAEKPLGYMSYHINTKAALEKFPALMTDMFQNPKFAKEDILVITDLISTIVDEEATAKLFDGDLSAFLYDVKEVEVMSKKYGYDDNYEEKVTEEKVKKTIPLFSVVFTSTHPTFGDKLLQLGVRKKVLVQNGNYYQILGTKEYGDIYILKDKDVVVVSNTLDYFSKGSGSFVKETKKDLGKNAIFGKLNISQTVRAFGTNTNEDELNKLNKIAAQFSDFTMESPKKLVDNKFKFVIKLNSLQNNKNIILQTLDLADEMMDSK
ncbi:hypothetical protein HNP37_000956 [Flavobacterium nitrogenifigens]|uniref:DUF4836 family protein n=2 Tax=Flavobacterium TaxID=237 RepID=A0A7W7IUQ7_9FLAO|nr:MULTISPECIES: hypothetical protein [Flavobacterium]MBB4800917.1 hypothetical protein [Flavobacterium nitrogenifigens]MBB6385335.1 hypothetical protein [Flavobacterium notoginsengisoli]